MQKKYSMYDRQLNTSRTSLTTNSSKTSRIVRKRDVNKSNTSIKDRSKNKQDECNTSFQQYLSRQSKLFGNNSTCILDRLNQQQNEIGNKGKGQKNDKPVLNNNSINSLILNQTLSAVNLKRTSAITERNDKHTPNRLILNRDQNEDGNEQKSKKRQLTPVKSKKQILQSIKRTQSIDISSQVFQLQLRISGLEQMLSIQKTKKQKATNQLSQALSDVKNLREILSQIQMQNKILENEKKVFEQKVQTLQKTVLQSQNNLALAQTNLVKLRQTIKQNRITELQLQIKKLSKLNEVLTQQNAKNNKLIHTLTQKLKYVTKQLEQMRKLGDLQIIISQQSKKQEYLLRQTQKIKKQYEGYKKRSQGDKEKLIQQKLITQQKQIFQLKQEIAKLLIKIHCLEYSKSKQISEIRQKGESQIKILRVKYSKMVFEMRNNCSPANQSSGKNGNLKSIGNNKNRLGMSKSLYNSQTIYKSNSASNLQTIKSMNINGSTPASNTSGNGNKGRNNYDLESRYNPTAPPVNISGSGIIQYNKSGLSLQTKNSCENRNIGENINIGSENSDSFQVNENSPNLTAKNTNIKQQSRPNSIGNKMLNPSHSRNPRHSDSFLLQLSPE